MKAKFEVEFLEPALVFIRGLEDKARRKVIYNIDKARFVNDPQLLKKLDHDIWEFRAKYAGKQFRLLAFWVKKKGKTTFVIATHGFVKKVSKVPSKEIDKARHLRAKYLKK